MDNTKIEKITKRGHDRLETIHTVKKDKPGSSRSNYDPFKCHHKISINSNYGKIE
jgi:hypothetical protein